VENSIEGTRPSFETLSSSVADDERALRQVRLALFGKVACLVAISLYVLGGALSILNPELEWLRHPTHPSRIMHLAAIAVLGGVWAACSTRRRLSWTTLRWLDGGAVVFVCTVYAAMGAFVPARVVPELAMILAVTNTLVARVVIVPTSTSRTGWIGALSSVATIASTWYVHYLAAGAGRATERALIAAGWLALAVVLVTLAARLVYGLRKQVREARTFGQYTLEDPIGRGGMGEVYRARHAMLRRPTALKLLAPGRGGQLDLIRFEREVQLTSQLTHPNTVAVYDYGRTPDGIFYYVMEYLDGVDLEELVRANGPQPPGRVAHVLRQICGALEEAHGVGLIHRDIKPANVILCERAGQGDVAKVVDFGLVKNVVELDGGTRATNANLIAGTPMYLPPESLLAPDKIDRRADLYAVGAVGYYLLTGKTVFEGRTSVEVFDHTIHTRPVRPAERLGRPLPKSLEGVVLACLEKDPNARPATAQDVLTRLENLGDLEAWTAKDARAWWEEHTEAIHRWRVEKSAQGLAAQTPARKVTVDLRLR